MLQFTNTLRIISSGRGSYRKVNSFPSKSRDVTSPIFTRFFGSAIDNNEDKNIWKSNDPLDSDVDEETEGEWAGCKRQFFAPLQISVRGAGKALFNGHTHIIFTNMADLKKFLSFDIFNVGHLSMIIDILTDPLFNKGTAFKSGERDRLRFRGLVPPRVLNIKLQKERVLEAVRKEDSNIRKYLILEDLHDRNETLYHRVIMDHIEEMAPLIYTPTVGQACNEFAARFRRPRGMYFCEVRVMLFFKD